MKLISYTIDGRSGIGGLVDGGIVDVSTRMNNGITTMRALIENDAWDAARRALKGASPDHPLSAVRFDPVITNPSKILCVGLNYEDHRLETARAPSKYPTVFTRFADTQVGHGGAIIKPRHSDKVDYEAELAVIIGKPGRDISESDAGRHIAGYACYNDVSVRDFQGHTTQFTPGKNFPGTGAFGPAFVTPDELGTVGPQRIQSRLNGKVMQDAHLSDMIFSIARLIAYISQWTMLSPGDVLITGTPGGVGFKRVPPVYLADGDEIVVEIDGVGLLRNPVKAESKEQHR